MASSSLWQRFKRYFWRTANLIFFLDIRRMKFPEDFSWKMQPHNDPHIRVTAGKVPPDHQFSSAE